MRETDVATMIFYEWSASIGNSNVIAVAVVVAVAAIAVTIYI